MPVHLAVSGIAGRRLAAVGALRAAVARRRWSYGAVAIAALVTAFAWPLQGGLENEKSHYALVRALADGTPWIDETLYETGDYVTNDITFWGGHTYSNKAPGLAFLSLPVYLGARAAGVSTDGEQTRMFWVLSLFGSVLSALVVLLLVRAAVDRIVPGAGATAAVVIGAATLFLPFATVFYAHTRSAMLVFCSFAALFLLQGGERRRSGGAALAGLAAGVAVMTEYPCLLAALVFAGYAAAVRPRLARVAAYGAGFAIGVAPLLVYNRWAFGSLFHFSWAGSRPVGGALEAGQVAGRTHPTLERLLEELFGFSGFFTMAPVLVLAVVGLALLARRGFALEAAVIGAVSTAFVVFNASYGSGFDDWIGGERYLVPILPLLALPLACALVRWPATTGALALVSAVLAIALASSHIRGGSPDWLGPLFDRRFPLTVLSFAGITGWYAMLPFFLLLAVAFVAAVAAAPRVHTSPAETLFAGVASIGWATLAASAPQFQGYGGESDELGSYLAVPMIAVSLAAVAVLLRFGLPPASSPRRTHQPRAE